MSRDPEVAPLVEPPEDDATRRRLYLTFVKVLTVQLVALLALWWLQSRFGA